MSAKNSIQVAIKLRPLIGKEKDLTSCWRVVDNSIQLVDSQSEPFYFDHIFDQDVKNPIIFEKMAKHIVHSAIEGFNGTIFAYGQTSSGKTYTMMGDGTNPGVMVLAAKEIFKQILSASDRQFLLRVGYIEIYNEKIYDLLNKKNQDLKIHDTNTGVSVNCEEIVITSEEDLLNILHAGSKERTVGETNMNERSSRSHAIFRITIESRKVDRSEDDTVIQSVINLVDLAGSERANQTGATGARLKEGGHINKSLMFLSNVIKNLSENEDHKYISYRDSKLTRILQASLGGNALTAIICTIKPTAIEETQSTLSFAMRAKTIKNKPQVNETVSDATMMKRLENEIKQLKLCLHEERKKSQSKIKVGLLEEKIKNTLIKIISVNSLSNVRKTKDARRRTWCSTSVMNESSLQVPNQEIETLKQSNAHAFFTPHITCRDKENIYTSNQSDIVEDEEEDFVEGTSPKIANDIWDNCKTPKKNNTLKANVTPKLAMTAARNLQIVENALSELEELTNLENTILVKHDAYAALKEKMDILQKRNAGLENERLDYLQLKSYFDLTKQELNESEKRCNELQIQVSKLLNAQTDFESKVQCYETELKTFENRVKELEMESQEAVNREFEFQRQLNKFHLREAELLEALSEERSGQKVPTVSLQQIQSKYDMIQAKYTQLQKDYESLQSGSTDTLNENTNLKQENMDLQSEIGKYKSLLEESEMKKEKENANLHSQITIYNELKEEYGSLKNSLIDTLNENTMLKEEMSSLQRQIQSSEELKVAYETLKTSSVSAVSENFNLKEENANLMCQIKKLIDLKEEYESLKSSSMETLSENIKLKEENGNLMCQDKKYMELKEEYATLKNLHMDTLDENMKIKEQNLNMRSEMTNLSTNIVELKRKLLESFNQCNNEENCDDLKRRNCELENELSATTLQFQDLRKEFDELSNQLMDSLQEGDDLREKCLKLEEQIKNKNMNILKDTGHDGMLLKEGLSQNNSDLLIKFDEIFECLHEIEFELRQGKTRVFVSQLVTPLSETENSSNKRYKLLLNSIEEICCLESNFDLLKSEVIQGCFKQNQFHIFEINHTKESNGEMEHTNQHFDAEIEKLRVKVDTLTKENSYLLDENKSLLESTERTVKEMREQIMHLSSELFEKSMVLEKCACDDYQRQISHLEKERCDITMVCEQLKEQVDKHVSTGENSSFHDVECELKTELQRKSDLINELEMQLDAMKSQCDAHLIQLTELQKLCDEKLDSMQSQMQLSENNFKEENNRLQLELYEKLEVNETLSRELLRKTQECEKAEENRNSTEYELCKLKEEYAIMSKQKIELESEQQVKITSLQLEIEETVAAFKECKQKELELQNEICSLEKYKSDLATEHENLLLKNGSLKVLYDSVLIEKNNLEVKLKEAAKHDDELVELKHKVNAMKKVGQEYEACKTENISLREKFETLNVEHKQLVLKVTDILEENKILETQFSNSKTKANERIEQIKVLQEQLNVKLQKIFELEENNMALKSQYEDSFEKLQNEKSVLQDNLEKQIDEKTNIANAMEIMKCKIETLSSDIQEAHDKLVYCGRIHANYDVIEKNCKELKQERETLRSEIEAIRHQFEQMSETSQCSNKQIESQKSRIHFLEQELQASNMNIMKCKESEKNLLGQLQAHINNVSEMSTMETRVKDLQSSLQELRLKYSSLEDMKTHLQEKNACLERQLERTINIEMECERVKCELQEALKEKIEIHKHVQNLQGELTKLQYVHKEQTSLLNKERALKEDMVKLEGTISCLLLEKKTLEEKCYAAEVCFKRAEQELSSLRKTDSANTSMESASNSFSALRRKSFDKNCIESNHLKAEDKMYSKRQMSSQKNQKNRRLSSHDENRPHASWDSTRDVAIMTDPIDSNCNCIELDKKLKDCEKELFIRESQVAALKMELRNHPMITENEALKKRLEQEQERNLLQIKKYKEIIIEQRTKSNQVSVETQTEFELDATFHKLLSKYNDLKNICRSRYTLIKTMQTQHSEIADQLKKLQTQCEKANKELGEYKLKYEDAKEILALRMDEINKLRA